MSIPSLLIYPTLNSCAALYLLFWLWLELKSSQHTTLHQNQRRRDRTKYLQGIMLHKAVDVETMPFGVLFFFWYIVHYGLLDLCKRLNSLAYIIQLRKLYITFKIQIPFKVHITIFLKVITRFYLFILCYCCYRCE